jgi:hypothetical protein
MTFVQTLHYNSVFYHVRTQSVSTAYIPFSDELDTPSHVTHLTTTNLCDVKKQKVVRNRCRGNSVDRAEPRKGSSRQGYD